MSIHTELTDRTSLCAAVVCCLPTGNAYVTLATTIHQVNVTCPTPYAVTGLYYTSMTLAGTLLDDEGVWTSLNTLQFITMSGEPLRGHAGTVADRACTC